MIITQQITAGNWFEFSEQGDFFRILTDSAATTFDVEFYSSGKEIVDAYAVKAGYSERFIGSTFDRVRIRAAVASTVQFVMRLGNVVGYDIAPTGQVSGTVAVSGFTNAYPFVTSAPVVTNVAANIAGARAARKYLLIQNRDSVGNIWIRPDSLTATVQRGIQIGPGDSWEVQGICPNGSIWVIGDIESNANILIVEA